MKRLLQILFLVIPVFLSCEKPSTGFVIPPPNYPKDPVQGDGNGSGSGGSQGGNEETPPTPRPAPEGTFVVGYATYWDKTMPDPTLLTHINYSFAHIKSDFESLDIKEESRLVKIAALKSKRPELKVLLSVGGWGAGNFSEMAADANHRKAFCKNCLTAVEKYKLDGIDLDWEYPTSSAAGISASPSDTRNFTELLKDLRVTLGDKYLITMASADNADYVDFKNAIDYLDFVNLMTYDMGKPPYHNAGLYHSGKTQNSCDESVAKHFSKGVPYRKMVLGIPFFGHGDGKAFSRDGIDYKDINPGSYSVLWDQTARVPYLADAAGTMVLSYDDESSVALKADYVKQKGMLGAMYWNIEADDAAWTLSKAIASVLLPGSVSEEDAVLVTNPYVQKYLEEVTYTDTEYTTTSILGYPGGGPGTADIPPAYTLSWTADPSAGALTLKVWESDWSREFSLPGGTASQSLTNLVPGRRYQYLVTATSGGKVVAKGSFLTRGLLHQIYFKPNVRNGRDLGGWKAMDGKTVAFRKLYRGGLIDKDYCNADGVKEMLAEGIKADLDLREPGDTPSKSPLGSGVSFFAPGFESGYNHMVRDNPAKVKACFEFVVDCLRKGKPVYFHCWSGRDRTGTMAVLLLGTLGVSESDMAKDYELTYFSPPDWSMYQGSYQHTRNNYSYPSIRKTIFSQTDSGTYQERIVKYLLKIGVSQKDIDDFRAIMLE